MAAVNIGADNASDQFYRYKMPKLQARIEGRGNGIKTNVVNNVEVAKALERPADYIVKFYGCELGAQTKFDKKTGTSIVNGAHDTGKLVELLEGFIKKYVQCYSCGNPETVVKVRKENIFLKCKACGAVSDVDARHKLNTYILKNPPEEKVSKAEKKLKKMEKERMQDAAGENLDKEDRKKKKDKKKKKKGEGEEGSGGGDDDEDNENGNVDDGDEVVWMTDTSEAAAQARAQEQLSSAMAAMVTQGNIEAEAEAKRKAEEKRAAEEAAAEAAAAEARKAEQQAEAARKAEAAAAAEAEARNPVLRLRKLIAKQSGVAAAEAVRGLDVEGGLAGRMRVLYEALFGDVEEGAKLADRASAHAALLAALAPDPASQMAQLLGLEFLLGQALPARVKQVALVLKVLYDEDVVEEDIILAWHSKPAAGAVVGVAPAAGVAVREAARPLVAWLREAESDDSDEE
ncbi:hypothetical protein WJX81_003597 [Elliptochloris bilobata]|uniref:W2 domain-containing protein n=1 Tax=Elliptochloris bilobata TaxID=381761 RepID=A0AAW1RHQ3_9CHLO